MYYSIIFQLYGNEHAQNTTQTNNNQGTTTQVSGVTILVTALSHKLYPSDHPSSYKYRSSLLCDLKMDASDAVRQAAEIESLLELKDQLYKDAIEIKTPALFNRLQRIRPNARGQLEVKKCLSFHINFASVYPDELPNFILIFEFPLDYPSCAACRIKAVRGDSSIYKSCTMSIEKYLEAFSGFECVELVLDWIIDNKETCLTESSSESDGNSGATSTSSDREGKIQCYVLRYNHLLSGPEHKKEKSMLDTAKKSILQGGLLWGTPGIVVVVPPSTEDDAKEYGSDCRTIGKRPDGVEEIWLSELGIEEAGLGGFAQQKRGGKLQELDTAGLRTACGGDEDLLRWVLGVH